jgi:hypothetical protein
MRYDRTPANEYGKRICKFLGWKMRQQTPHALSLEARSVLKATVAGADDRAALNLLGNKLTEVGFFDRDWYLKQYQDVAATKLEPLDHFLYYGVFESRDPNPLFHALQKCGMKDQRERLCERLADSGSSPVDYFYNLQLAYRDFSIVSHVRSGSHLLATAMNSHPQICCQGELLQLLMEPHKPYAPVSELATGTVNGAIIMYEHWHLAAALGLIPRKLIHLTRNPRKTALSFIRNNEHLKMHGAQHNPHAWRVSSGLLEMRDYPVDEELLVQRIAQVEDAQQRFRRLLPSPAIEVTYEELCSDLDVHSIDQKAANRISGFLQVRSEKMITPLQKTSSS